MRPTARCGGVDASAFQTPGERIVGFPAKLPTHAFESKPDTAITAVPEPGTYAMLLAGLGVVGTMVARRKATAAAC